MAFAPLVKKKKLSISLEATEECSGYFDVDKLDKIIYNLLSNAAKYTPEGGAITLCQSYDEETGLLKITVNNPGECIPEEKLAHLFERFYEGEYRKFHTIGTGIGLSLTKDLVALHHGTIHAFSNKEEGNTFVVQIPVRREAFKEEEIDESMEYAAYNVLPIGEVQEAVATDMAEREPGSSSLLLVEDNVELLNLTRDSLVAWFRVLKAPNGRAALEILEQESVDVIVSDVMMPEMNGLELCSKVKSEIDYSHIPVILLTAKTTLESKVEGLECGADVYIEKPFSIKQLHKQIENLLRLRQSFHKLMVSLSGNANQASAELAMTQRDCEFVAKIQEVIADQLADENFSIDTLAEQMNMSRSNFYRKIKALSGMSPNDYLKALRMNKAAELIQGGTRISEVAAQVGFTSSSYFAKCFKAQYGVLPKEYVNQLSASDTAAESTPDADSTI